MQQLTYTSPGAAGESSRAGERTQQLFCYCNNNNFLMENANINRISSHLEWFSSIYCSIESY